MNDKKYPHSVEAEQSVIGSVLIAPQVWDDVSYLTEEDFYITDHKAIWGFMKENPDAREVVALMTACKTDDQRIYVGQIARNVFSAVNAGRHARIIRNRAILRRMVSECLKFASSVNESTDPSEVIQNLTSRLESISDGATMGGGLVHIHDIASEWFPDFRDRLVTGKKSGIETGFPDLDERWNGLRGGCVYVLAGRPKTGKTTLALNIAEHTSKTFPTAIFQMEMSGSELVERAIASQGGVSVRSIRNAVVDEENLSKVVDAIHKLKNSKLFVDPTPCQSIDYIRLQSKAFVKKHGKGPIFIDYLGLIRTDSFGGNKNNEIADVSRDIKLLAKETDCPVILLCQMNRAVEREKRKPQLSDLRDSGAIEQDADVICFTHKDFHEQNYSEIITRAMRSGEPGTDYLLCEFGYSRFRTPPEGWEPEEKPTSGSDKGKKSW